MMTPASVILPDDLMQAALLVLEIAPAWDVLPLDDAHHVEALLRSGDLKHVDVLLDPGQFLWALGAFPLGRWAIALEQAMGQKEFSEFLVDAISQAQARRAKSPRQSPGEAENVCGDALDDIVPQETNHA